MHRPASGCEAPSEGCAGTRSGCRREPGGRRARNGLARTRPWWLHARSRRAGEQRRPLRSLLGSAIGIHNCDSQPPYSQRRFTTTIHNNVSAISRLGRARQMIRRHCTRNLRESLALFAHRLIRCATGNGKSMEGGRCDSGAGSSCWSDASTRPDESRVDWSRRHGDRRFARRPPDVERAARG